MNWTQEHRNQANTQASWAMRALFVIRIRYWYTYFWSGCPHPPKCRNRANHCHVASFLPTTTTTCLLMPSLPLSTLQGPKVSTSPPPYPIFTNPKTTGTTLMTHAAMSPVLTTTTTTTSLVLMTATTNIHHDDCKCCMVEVEQQDDEEAGSRSTQDGVAIPAVSTPSAYLPPAPPTCTIADDYQQQHP